MDFDDVIVGDGSAGSAFAARQAEYCVVDPRLNMRGLDGLCMVRTSIMPTLIAGNAKASTIMPAGKAADMIRADVGLDIAAE